MILDFSEEFENFKLLDEILADYLVGNPVDGPMVKSGSPMEKFIFKSLREFTNNLRDCPEFFNYLGKLSKALLFDYKRIRKIEITDIVNHDELLSEVVLKNGKSYAFILDDGREDAEKLNQSFLEFVRDGLFFPNKHDPVMVDNKGRFYNEFLDEVDPWSCSISRFHQSDVITDEIVKIFVDYVSNKEIEDIEDIAKNYDNLGDVRLVRLFHVDEICKVDVLPHCDNLLKFFRMKMKYPVYVLKKKKNIIHKDLENEVAVFGNAYRTLYAVYGYDSCELAMEEVLRDDGQLITREQLQPFADNIKKICKDVDNLTQNS